KWRVVNGELSIGHSQATIKGLCYSQFTTHNSQLTTHNSHHASCPIHRAPPMLSLAAPVTVESTLYSCRQRRTPIKAMIIASLYFIRFSPGTTTLIFMRFNSSLNL